MTYLNAYRIMIIKERIGGGWIRKLENTTGWILKQSDVLAWLRGEGPQCLWLSGIGE